MKKSVVILMLMMIVLLSVSIFSNVYVYESFFHMITVISLIFFLNTLVYTNINDFEVESDNIVNLNELYKTIIDSDNRLFYLKDHNLKYVFVNKALVSYYVKDYTEIIGCDDFDLVDTKFAKLRRKTDLEVLEKKTSLVIEVKEGNRIYKANKFPMKLLNGKYGVAAYIEDVTDEMNIKTIEEKTLLRNSILVDVFSQSFTSSHDQLDYVLNKAIQLTESRYGYIYLYDEDTQEFILNTWSNGVMDNYKINETETRYELERSGLWGVAIRKPIVINDFKIRNAINKGFPKGHLKFSKFMAIPVIIEDQIVAVIGLANKEYDYDDNDVYQISVLMTGAWNAKERRERTIELERINAEIKDNQENLQLILDSAAEAIYGIDRNGNCTFCNLSSLKMLGYTNQEDLIGKNMHFQIHHTRKDGTPMPINECSILKALVLGEGIQVDDEVFWRADGTSIEVEYFSYPQQKDGEIIGAVVTFMDITERKKAEENIRFLSYHDSLTGLYNRMFFEEEQARVDTKRNLPISIIIGDVNGLKLTNDVFGHASGDLLLKKAAEILKKVCRADDILSRIGGDEFAILLPRTRGEEAEVIISRVKNEFSKENSLAIKCSISMGFATKEYEDQSIITTQEKAEDKMYIEKTLSRKSINEDLINTIIETLRKKIPSEEEHSKSISEICEKIGKAMGLPDVEIRRLKEAGFLHDIGKVVLDEGLPKNEEDMTEQERKEMNQHPAIGYRILNFFNDTIDLAEPILAHHENWDGTGYPKGLKGEEIPKLARILALAESYDEMMNPSNKNIMSKEDAVKEIQKQAGTKFDPEIVNYFVKMMAI